MKKVLKMFSITTSCILACSPTVFFFEGQVITLDLVCNDVKVKWAGAGPETHATLQYYSFMYVHTYIYIYIYIYHLAVRRISLTLVSSVSGRHPIHILGYDN